MFGQEVLQEAALRHAAFYVEQLKQISDRYQQGSSQARDALVQFDLHWSQIVQGQSWTVSSIGDRNARLLCSQYCDWGAALLSIRLPLDQWIMWLQSGLEAARQLDDQEAVVRHLNNLGQAYLTHTRLEQSVSTYRQALAQASEIGYRPGEARAMVGLGRVASLTPTKVDMARDYLLSALTIYQEIDDRHGVGWSLQNLGSVEERYGDLSAARRYVQRALDTFRQIDNRRYVASALSRLASIIERQGDYPTSKRHLHEALTIARESDDYGVLANGLQTLGLIASFEGDLELSQRYYEEALEVSTNLANRMLVGNCLLNLGWLATENEHYLEAIRHYQAALSLYTEMGYPKRVASTTIALGEVYLRLQEFEQARRLFLDGLAIAHEVSSIRDMVEVLLCLARIAVQEGQFRKPAEILGLATRYTENQDADIRTKRVLLRQALEAVSSGIELESAVERGKGLDLIAVVNAYLDDM